VADSEKATKAHITISDRGKKGSEQKNPAKRGASSSLTEGRGGRPVKRRETRGKKGKEDSRRTNRGERIDHESLGNTGGTDQKIVVEHEEIKA